MPKRKRSRKFSRLTRRFRGHRKHDRRIPLSVGIGLVTSFVAPPAPGWETPMSALQRGDFATTMQSLVRSWTGLAIGGIGGQQNTSFNMMNTLNPFNMNEAAGLKATFWSAIALKISKMLIKKSPIDNIPIVKKFVKWA
jgi:hypothetical protein